jgi:hypothetical protein
LADYHYGAEGIGITDSIFMEMDVSENDLVSEAAWFCTLTENPAKRL